MQHGARKNLLFRFLTEDESRQESSALKIARIRKTGVPGRSN